MSVTPVCYTGRHDAACASADRLFATLQHGLKQAGRASLFVSGGTSPGAVFDDLATRRLDWDKVTIGPVDERWVKTDDPRSNEALIRARLLTGAAQVAHFVPLKTDAAHPEQAVPERSEALAPFLRTPLAILLGMGEDGHIASWFPGSRSLEAAMDPDNPAKIAAIDATGCPVAGDTPLRLTLTASALALANYAIMLIFGESKWRIYEAACHSDPARFPVRRAMDLLGDRLHVIWAP